MLKLNRGVQVTYIVGSVYVSSVVLIKERHEVQEQVEGAVHRLLPSYTVSTVPVLKKYKKPWRSLKLQSRPKKHDGGSLWKPVSALKLKEKAAFARYKVTNAKNSHFARNTITFKKI